MRSNSVPLSSGSMAYFPEVKKELAATPAENREKQLRRRGEDTRDKVIEGKKLKVWLKEMHLEKCNKKVTGKDKISK